MYSCLRLRCGCGEAVSGAIVVLGFEQEVCILLGAGIARVGCVQQVEQFEGPSNEGMLSHLLGVGMSRFVLQPVRAQA